MTTPTQRNPFYRTYKFRLNEKDPVIDMVKTAMDDAGYTIGRAHKESGVSTTTLYNWLDGPTRRPSHAAVAAVIGAMGKEFAVVDTKRRANGHALDAHEPRFIKRFRSLPARS